MQNPLRNMLTPNLRSKYHKKNIIQDQNKYFAKSKILKYYGVKKKQVKN